MNDFRFYFSIGWQHILSIEALDHLLFIAALAAIYLLTDWRQVLLLVTAFTAGHTITLILSTKQWVEVPSGLVEFLIPCTIVLTAISNLFQKSFAPKALRFNYALALFFGLIHGLAFANTLRMVLATGQSFALSMFSFSVGLECGQVLVVLFILLLSHFFVSWVKVDRRHWVIFVSGAVASLALEMAIGRWPTGESALTRSGIWFETKRSAGAAIEEKPWLQPVPLTAALKRDPLTSLHKKLFIHDR